jgi:hypothetical protein
MIPTLARLDLALKVSQDLGYTIRQEFLGGSGGGACELRGRKYLFVDLALHVTEQLEQVCEALRDDPRLLSATIPVELRADLVAPRQKAG